jgi:hypothetical protein
MPGRRSLAPLALLALACGREAAPVTGGFEEIVIDGRIAHGQGVRLVDLDGNGRLDVVAALSLTDAVHAYLQGDDPRDSWERVVIGPAGTLVAMDVAVADLDGDGDLDVAAAGLFTRAAGNQSPGEVIWYENPGDPRGRWLARPITGPTYPGARALAATDLDGDGRTDLVVGAQEALTGTVAEGRGLAWLRNEGGRFAAPGTIDAALRGVVDVVAADLDGDGRPELVASGAGLLGGDLALYRDEGQQQGAPRFVKRGLLEGRARNHGLALDDLDGDGRGELLVALTHTASTTVERLVPPASPREPWRRERIVTDLRDPEPAPGQPPGARDDSPRLATADVDGDGRRDLLVSTLEPGELRVYRQAGLGWLRRDVRTGYPISRLTAGDVDGDGLDDVVTSTYDLGTRDRIAWWRNAGE